MRSGGTSHDTQVSPSQWIVDNTSDRKLSVMSFIQLKKKINSLYPSKPRYLLSNLGLHCVSLFTQENF